MPSAPLQFTRSICLVLALISPLALSACIGGAQQQNITSQLPEPASSTPLSEPNYSVDHFAFGDYSSSAWISEQYAGQHVRQFQGETLVFAVDQNAEEGGLDVGLSSLKNDPQPVLQAKENLFVCSSYDMALSGEGRWWAGPKVSVNWQGTEAAKQNGDDWYENYIVEIASSTPDELHAIFTDDYFKAEVLPETELAGATYKHYKIRFHSWWQFWSVRQDYRSEGKLPLEPILDVWIANGLPTARTFDGVKANVETYGPIQGYGTLRMQSSATYKPTTSCE